MTQEHQGKSWYWPKIVDIEGAKNAAESGFWAVIIAAALVAFWGTLGLAYPKEMASLVHPKDTASMNAWDFLFVVVLFVVALGFIAWRIKKYSRAFAIAGVALFVVSTAMVAQSLNALGSIFAVILLAMSIYGARGIFAYHRFSASASLGLAEESISRQSASSGPAAGSERTNRTIRAPLLWPACAYCLAIPPAQLFGVMSTFASWPEEMLPTAFRLYVYFVLSLLFVAGILLFNLQKLAIPLLVAHLAGYALLNPIGSYVFGRDSYGYPTGIPSFLSGFTLLTVLPVPTAVLIYALVLWRTKRLK